MGHSRKVRDTSNYNFLQLFVTSKFELVTLQVQVCSPGKVVRELDQTELQQPYFLIMIQVFCSHPFLLQTMHWHFVRAPQDTPLQTMSTILAETQKLCPFFPLVPSLKKQSQCEEELPSLCRTKAFSHAGWCTIAEVPNQHLGKAFMEICNNVFKIWPLVMKTIRMYSFSAGEHTYLIKKSNYLDIHKKCLPDLH